MYLSLLLLLFYIFKENINNFVKTILYKIAFEIVIIIILFQVRKVEIRQNLNVLLYVHNIVK